MIPRKILFTGPPGCGKTALLENIVKNRGKPARGFVTREIREMGRRVGFTVNTLDGKQGLLAHRRIKSPHTVGKYGVDIDVVDRIAVPAMIPERPGVLVVVDEIGRMECFSSLFKRTLMNLLDSEHPVVGSIALKGDMFINAIKARADVSVVLVTERNRDGLVDMYSSFFENK